MKINYWDCPHINPEEYKEGEWSYGCTHPDSEEGYCPLDNKYGGRKADCLLVNKSDLGSVVELETHAPQRHPVPCWRSITFTPDLGDKVLKDFVCDIFWGPEFGGDAIDDLIKHVAYPDGSDIFFSWDCEGKDIAVFRIPDFQPEGCQFWAQVVIPELTKDGVTFYIHYGDTKIIESLARPKEVYRLACWATASPTDELGMHDY